jgi:hypothetical protein
LVAMLALAALVVAGWVWYQHKFPYGSSHCCSKMLGTALRLFAEDHSGWLPHGQATPEASLSLLCAEEPYMAEILRGKTVLRKVVDEALAKDGVLGPRSCGWHYIEGLNERDDSSEIAVIWDKVEGLGHDGDYHPTLAHEILLLDGSINQIDKREWPAFVEHQKQLLAATMAKRSQRDPPIRWSDEATLGPNVNPPRLAVPAGPEATQTNTLNKSP